MNGISGGSYGSYSDPGISGGTLSNKFYDMEKLNVKYKDGLLSISCPLKPKFPPEPPQEPEIDIEIK